MKSLVLIKRYTLGLLNSVQEEAEYASLYQHLRSFSITLSARKKLFNHLTQPFLPASKKHTILEEILNKAKMPAKATRFVLLLVENERLELLPDIIEIMPDLWNETRGVQTFEVSSVIPLTDNQQKRLKEKLEHLENAPVALRYKNDPALIGGLSLRKGNIVYDVSLRGNLERLLEQIIEG